MLALSRSREVNVVKDDNNHNGKYIRRKLSTSTSYPADRPCLWWSWISSGRFEFKLKLRRQERIKIIDTPHSHYQLINDINPGIEYLLSLHSEGHIHTYTNPKQELLAFVIEISLFGTVYCSRHAPVMVRSKHLPPPDSYVT